MDRFEGMHLAQRLLQEHYLHSSMDRFEGLAGLQIFSRLLYLHSSMDRFEVATEIIVSLIALAFTFQYG